MFVWARRTKLENDQMTDESFWVFICPFFMLASWLSVTFQTALKNFFFTVTSVILVSLIMRRVICKHPHFLSLQGFFFKKKSFVTSSFAHIQNVTRAFSVRRGIPRLPLPYLSQWASSTLTHSDNAFVALTLFCCWYDAWRKIAIPQSDSEKSGSVFHR